MSAPLGISEIELRRARWQRHRDSLGLTDADAAEFALGGLTAHSEAPDVRLVVLPSDPHLQPVSLDDSTTAWLSESRPSPYGGHPISWADGWRATSDALVSGARWTEHRGATTSLCTATAVSKRPSQGSAGSAETKACECSHYVMLSVSPGPRSTFRPRQPSIGTSMGRGR